MKWLKFRGLLALGLSVLVHCGVLGWSYLRSDPTLFAATSDELYQASDVMLDYVPEADQATREKVQRSARHFATQIEFIKVPGNLVDRLLGRSHLIARQVEDEKMRSARKAIPVVQHPAVKPRLIKQTPIPYPAEAGGESGVVVICFLVGYDGVPEYTSTAESSGNRFIDGAAVDACFHWRFSPARDTKGRLVRCLVYIPVTVKP